MPLDRMRETLGEVVRQLAPRPGRFELTTRLAVICALTVLVVEIYQTPDPALTVYVAFFLSRDSRTMSLIIDIVFVVLITLLIGFIVLVAMIVINDPMWRVISMSVISIGILFVASSSKLRPLGGTIALIVGYGLDLMGTIPLGIGEVATRGLLYAWLFVGIPAGVSMVVNLLLAPAPRRLAEQAIARRLQISAAMLQSPDEPTRSQFEEHLREGVGEIQEWLSLASREKTAEPRDLAALQQAAYSTVALMSAIDVMDRRPEAQLGSSQREYLAHLMDEMSAILKSGGFPIKIGWEAPEADRPLAPLEADVLAGIKEAIVGFADPPSLDGSPEEPKRSNGFFAADAFTNPDYVQYALKTTAAAMFCYILYSLLDWSGIHTAFITCYIVSLGTTAETVEKLTLRISGCLIGAAAGYGAIIFLIPYLTSITALMILVFVGALASGYVAAGSERISYAGFQMAFAFFLCVIQGPAPAFDLTVARDRVIGILIGNLVVYLLFTNLWPVSVSKRIDPAIAAVLRRLSTMMTVDPQSRRVLASEAQSGLAEIETNISLASYEPSGVCPTAAWLSARRGVAEEIGALESLLLISADDSATTRTQIANRLETLATRFAPSEIKLPTNPQVEWSASPILHIIDRSLLRLEEAPI
jgi:multidrug resistance protein MdtO